MEKMDLTDKLRTWGATHAQARIARQQSAAQRGGESSDLHEKARDLQQRADALHREIYGQLGSKQHPGG